MKTEYFISLVYLLAITIFFLFGVAISPMLRSDIDFVDRPIENHSDHCDPRRCEH